MNPEEILAQAPDMLRQLADAIEAMNGGGQAPQGAQGPVDLEALAAPAPEQGA